VYDEIDGLRADMRTQQRAMEARIDQRVMLLTPQHAARTIDAKKLIKGIPQRMAEHLVDSGLLGALKFGAQLAVAGATAAFSSRM